jgi:hypothetical protein
MQAGLAPLLHALAFAAIHPTKQLATVIDYVLRSGGGGERDVPCRVTSSLLRLAGGGGICSGHVVFVGPGDEAVRREAALALLGAPPRPLARRQPIILLPLGDVLGGRGGVAERAPALGAVEAGQVGVEVDPHHGLLQLRVSPEQVDVAVHERLQHLHRKQSRSRHKHDGCCSIKKNSRFKFVLYRIFILVYLTFIQDLKLISCFYTVSK